LTYNSISDAIKVLEGTSLFRFPPECDNDDRARFLWVPKDLLVTLDEDLWKDERNGERLAQTRYELENFVLLGFITMGKDPFEKDGRAMMAPVSPVTEGVFDFRTFHEDGGIRTFGCFAAKDEFIALTLAYREDLVTSEDWDDAVADCKAAWRDLFGDLAPYSAEDMDGYLSYAETV
jgi:hypothetical protein